MGKKIQVWLKTKRFWLALKSGYSKFLCIARKIIVLFRKKDVRFSKKPEPLSFHKWYILYAEKDMLFASNK